MICLAQSLNHSSSALSKRQGFSPDQVLLILAFMLARPSSLILLDEPDDPNYPLELFLRVVTMGLETMKVVKGLPGLEVQRK